MRRFFTGQAKRVTKAWVEAGGYLASSSDGEYKDASSQLLGVGENEAILAASRPYVLEMTVTSLNAAGDLVGAESIVGTDPMALFLTDRSAQRVVKVNDATRRGIQRTITRGQAAGFSPREIAYTGADRNV